MKQLTRKQLLAKGKVINGVRIHTTAWYIETCNDFKVSLGSDKKNWQGPFGSAETIIELIRYAEEEFPDITYEVVPLEYNTKRFRPKKLTKLLIREEFF